MAYDYSQYGGVLVGRQNKVLTITLNSPETLNAFTGPMHTSMSRIWDDVNDDPDVHVVVLTGAGRAFSAGGNVIAMQKKIDDPDSWDAGMPEARRIVFRMLECDKPIIARVNGHAVGLGATIALLCDIIIAADHAKIGDPHVNAGLVAGDGGALIWPQLIGFARAKGRASGSEQARFARDSPLEEAVTSELVSKMPIPWLLGKIQGIPLRFRRDRL